jgi:hypothetical protein
MGRCRDCRDLLDANNGEVLYRHNLGGPIAGGIVSYASGSKQYVAAVSGFVGGYYHQMAPDPPNPARPADEEGPRRNDDP